MNSGVHSCSACPNFKTFSSLLSNLSLSLSAALDCASRWYFTGEPCWSKELIFAMQCDTLIMKYWSTNVHQHPIALSQLPMIIPDVALAIFQKTSDLILLTFLHVACESCRGTSILQLSSQAPRMWLRCMNKKEQKDKEDVTTLHRHGWKGNFWSSDNFSAQWQPALWRLSSVASKNSSYPSFICPQAVSFVICARVWFSPWILFWLGKFQICFRVCLPWLT